MEYDSKKLLLIGVMLISSLTFTTSKNITYTATLDTVEIKTSKTSKTFKVDSKEVKLLARLIYSEAGGEPYKGKLAVGNVVLNRMNRKKTSLYKIIFQKGQFDGVRTSRFKYKYKVDKSYQTCIKAATELLNGLRVIPNTVEFFHNPITSTDTGWTRKISKYKYRQIGNHLFCHNPNLM